MFRAAKHRGRLVEIEIAAPITSAELARSGADVDACLRTAAPNAVVLVDLRGSRVFQPDIAEMLTELAAGHSRWILRAAFLVRPDPILESLVERIIRRAGPHKRRLCRSANEVRSYLEPVLSLEEAVDLEVVLGKSPPAVASPRRRARPRRPRI